MKYSRSLDFFVFYATKIPQNKLRISFLQGLQKGIKIMVKSFYTNLTIVYVWK